jgi:hypothetical protein
MSAWLLWFAHRGSSEGLFLLVSPGVSRLVFVGMVFIAWSRFQKPESGVNYVILNEVKDP